MPNTELMKEVAEKGTFVATMVFFEVPGEGVFANFKVNADYFASQELAEEIFDKVQKAFVKEMIEAKIFILGKITIQ